MIDPQELRRRRGTNTARGGKHETVTSSFVLVGNYLYPACVADMVLRARIGTMRPVLSGVADPALRAVLQEAHAERLGIWVAIWPVTLLVLSFIVEKKVQG